MCCIRGESLEFIGMQMTINQGILLAFVTKGRRYQKFKNMDLNTSNKLLFQKKKFKEK